MSCCRANAQQACVWAFVFTVALVIHVLARLRRYKCSKVRVDNTGSISVVDSYLWISRPDGCTVEKQEDVISYS